MSSPRTATWGCCSALRVPLPKPTEHPCDHRLPPTTWLHSCFPLPACRSFAAALARAP